MSTPGEYIAAGLIHIASGMENGISVPREGLSKLFSEYWRMDITEADLSTAVRILNRCDISYSEADDFAGTFVVINQQRYRAFLRRVESEEDEYSNSIKHAEDQNDGINRAERLTLPSLESYNLFPVLRKYNAFGKDWIERAMDGLREGYSAVATEGATVALERSDPALQDIKVAAADLAKLIRRGNDIGDLTPEQASVAAVEIEQLGQALENNSVRSSDFSRRAQSTLNWVAKQAAGTIIGQAAKTLLAAILLYFGISM